MDITKMLSKETHARKAHKNSEAGHSEAKESFDSVLNEHKKVRFESKEDNEVKTPIEDNASIEDDDSKEVAEFDDLESNKIIEAIEKMLQEPVEDSDDDSVSLMISLLVIMNKLTSGFGEPVEIPKNPDGTINIEGANNLINDLLEKHEGLNLSNEMQKPILDMIGSNNNFNKEVNQKDALQKLEKLVEIMTKKPELIEKLNIKGFEGIVEKLKEVIANPEDKSRISSLKEDIKNILQSKLGIEEKTNAPIKKKSDFDNNTSNKDKSNESEIKSPKKEEKTEVVKEEKFLKSLISEENKGYDKFSISSFKSSFGRVDGVKSEPVITKGNAVFDMVKTVKFMQTNALKELTVKIYPKELGEITISISQDKDVMKANIKANTKDAYTLLNNNLVDIKKNLAEQNIKIQEVNISLYNDDTTFYREGQENRNSLFQEELKKGSGEVFVDEAIEEEPIYNGNVNMLA